MTELNRSIISQALPGFRFGRRTVRSSRGLLIAVLSVAALLLSSCNLFQSDSSTTEILQQNLPEDWVPVTGDASVEGFQTVNIDGDAEMEYLLFYHYDGTPDPSNGPIGGIIYDGQQDTSVYDSETSIPIPLQPLAFFVPYRLLPDWTAGKGQGYLGDSTVTQEQTPDDEDPATDFSPELIVVGSGASGANRLSLFRWLGLTQGYGVSYFQGSYSVTMPDWTPGAGQRIDKVVTLDAFTDRSKLCKRSVWTRQGTSAQFNPTPQTVVFCLGNPPPQPTYPEAVVLAWLLTEDGSNLATSPEANALLRQVVPAVPQQIVSLSYPGEATITGTGNDTESRMTVESTIVLDGVQQVNHWQLQEIWASDGDGTTCWRIDSVD